MHVKMVARVETHLLVMTATVTLDTSEIDVKQVKYEIYVPS
jgi:hypothetical protein